MHCISSPAFLNRELAILQRSLHDRGSPLGLGLPGPPRCRLACLSQTPAGGDPTSVELQFGSLFPYTGHQWDGKQIPWNWMESLLESKVVVSGGLGTLLKENYTFSNRDFVVFILMVVSLRPFFFFLFPK